MRSTYYLASARMLEEPMLFQKRVWIQNRQRGLELLDRTERNISYTIFNAKLNPMKYSFIISIQLQLQYLFEGRFPASTAMIYFTEYYYSVRRECIHIEQNFSIFRGEAPSCKEIYDRPEGGSRKMALPHLFEYHIVVHVLNCRVTDY